MSNRITAISIDPFVKFKGLEVYGGFQNLKGSVYGDTSKGEWLKRSWNQAYGEVVYRIGAKENVYVGMRYITVSGEPNGMRYASGDASQGKTSGAQAKITSNRFSMAAGWFINKYMLLKAEYVTQSYNDYPVLDYRYEGNYKGIFVSAVIGF
jgi:hypothetical protein